MRENHSSTCATASPCSQCSPRIEALLEQVSQLEDEMVNLRRLEEAIKRNTALFQAMISHSRDGIVLTGPDRRIIRVVHSLLGNTPTELTGKPLEMLLHKDDREILCDCYRQLLSRTRSSVDCEARVRRRDGSFMWVEGTITDMLDEPSVQAIVCNYFDVTMRKLYELELAEFAAIVHGAEHAIFSKDVTGCILTWNPAAERMFGYASGEIVGRNIAVLIPHDRAEQEVQVRAEVCRTAQACEFQTERIRKDGGRIRIQVQLAPVLDRYGRVRGLSHISKAVS